MDTKSLRKLISIGNTENAIDKLLELTNSKNDQLNKIIIVISAEFKKFKENELLGLKPHRSELNSINSRLLTILSELDNRAEYKFKCNAWSKFKCVDRERGGRGTRPPIEGLRPENHRTGGGAVVACCWYSSRHWRVPLTCHCAGAGRRKRT